MCFLERSQWGCYHLSERRGKDVIYFCILYLFYITQSWLKMNRERSERKHLRKGSVLGIEKKHRSEAEYFF